MNRTIIFYYRLSKNKQQKEAKQNLLEFIRTILLYIRQQAYQYISSPNKQTIINLLIEQMSFKPHPSRVKSPLSKSTTQFFKSQSTIDQFITQFFLPKQHDYNQNILEFYSNTHNFKQQNLQIPNSEKELLYATLFYKSKLQKPPQNCIVYCHGFGSTRLQAVHVLKVLNEQLALCCFDFSGSGKSEGNITTYGAKEKEDIHSVLTYLKQKLSFKNFVLWGRSMGATASLFYSIKYEQAQQIQDQSVIFQVIDSPFVSFEKISLQLAKKFISMPQFGTNIVLDMMRKHCSSLKEYNPFSVNLENIQQCKVPTLFIYSENDDIVCCRNSQELCSKFSAFYEKMIITQNHNAPRSTQTLSEIIKKIEIQLKKCEIGKRNGIVFRSFISSKSNKSKSCKKGIQRSLRKQASSLIFDFSKPSSVHQSTQYGLLAGAKCQTPNPHSLNNYFKQVQGPHNSQPIKPTSMSAFPHEYDFQNYQSPFINTPQQTPKTHQFQPTSPSKNTANKSLFSNQATEVNPSQKHNLQRLQTDSSDNVYQMRKPDVLKNRNTKQTKRFSSPVNFSLKIENNPLTNFTRQEIFFETSKQNNDRYRDSQRRSSNSKKLNISLSKFKNPEKKALVFGEQKQSQQGDQRQVGSKFTLKRQRGIQSSPYILTSIKSSQMIRPISPSTNFQQRNYLNKSPYQADTPTTKAPSVSSSMDNLQIFRQKEMKSSFIQSPSTETQKKNIIQNMCYKNDGNNHLPKKIQESDQKQGRAVKKVRSSQIVYFDRNLYRYGI